VWPCTQAQAVPLRRGVGIESLGAGADVDKMRPLREGQALESTYKLVAETWKISTGMDVDDLQDEAKTIMAAFLDMYKDLVVLPAGLRSCVPMVMAHIGRGLGVDSFKTVKAGGGWPNRLQDFKGWSHRASMGPKPLFELAQRAAKRVLELDEAQAKRSARAASPSGKRSYGESSYPGGEALCFDSMLDSDIKMYDRTPVASPVRRGRTPDSAGSLRSSGEKRRRRVKGASPHYSTGKRVGGRASEYPAPDAPKKRASAPLAKAQGAIADLQDVLDARRALQGFKAELASLPAEGSDATFLRGRIAHIEKHLIAAETIVIED